MSSLPKTLSREGDETKSKQLWQLMTSASMLVGAVTILYFFILYFHETNIYILFFEVTIASISVPILLVESGRVFLNNKIVKRHYKIIIPGIILFCSGAGLIVLGLVGYL